MKNKGMIVTTAWLFIFCSSTSYALPALQLDITDGYYRLADETTVSTDEAFMLIALLDASKASIEEIYYISAAITPVVSAPADFGYFEFDGASIDVTSGMTYGTPPLDAIEGGDLDKKDLAAHSIFPTYFTQFAFSFLGSEEIEAYNTADAAEKPNSSLFAVHFLVDVSGLNEGYEIHFDLYNQQVLDIYSTGKDTMLLGEDIDADDFAPFSHDAGSGPAPVPEPATLVLLGSGLIGLAGLQRKRMHKQ